LTDQKDIGTRSETFGGRLIQEHQRLLAELLHAIAKVLGFKIEQLGILKAGTLQFWADIETEQAIIRKFVVDLACTRKVMPMGVVDYRSSQQVYAGKADHDHYDCGCWFPHVRKIAPS
jgi:hypothetical protein